MDPETKGDAEREGKMGVKEREQVKRERRCMGATVTPSFIVTSLGNLLEWGALEAGSPFGGGFFSPPAS